MSGAPTFQRRGVVEGFFGPLWSARYRAEVFEFGADRGMNTYLYAPKDDPYHRLKWREPYPETQWRELQRLIRLAHKRKIDFVYGFHPGKGLRFTADEPIRCLFSKAHRFYDEGVRTFAVLFDDIPSKLENAWDRKRFDRSLAMAEACWMKLILDREPTEWTDVEWWVCPSRYSEDPLLEKMFGAFEPGFSETFAHHLPESVACLWTGPSVVSKKITLSHVTEVKRLLQRRLILWDNYPVNDLSMSDEMHLGPLMGRDPRLPREVYGYLNNPLLQGTLGLVPLATCFDYARNPATYDPEKSWTRIIVKRFSRRALDHWLALREFCEITNRFKNRRGQPRLSEEQHSRLIAVHGYIMKNQRERWCREFRPWLAALENALAKKRT